MLVVFLRVYRITKSVGKIFLQAIADKTAKKSHGDYFCMTL